MNGPDLRFCSPNRKSRVPMSRSIVLNFTAMSSASEEDGWTGEIEVSYGWDNTAISSAY